MPSIPGCCSQVLYPAHLNQGAEVDQSLFAEQPRKLSTLAAYRPSSGEIAVRSVFFIVARSPILASRESYTFRPHNEAANNSAVG